MHYAHIEVDLDVRGDALGLGVGAGVGAAHGCVIFEKGREFCMQVSRFQTCGASAKLNGK